MRCRWVFSRGEQHTIITIARSGVNFVVHVHQPNGDARRTTVPTALEAILRQAEFERELTWSGWHLADYRRLGMPVSSAYPSRTR